MRSTKSGSFWGKRSRWVRGTSRGVNYALNNWWVYSGNWFYFYYPVTYIDIFFSYLYSWWYMYMHKTRQRYRSFQSLVSHSEKVTADCWVSESYPAKPFVLDNLYSSKLFLAWVGGQLFSFCGKVASRVQNVGGSLVIFLRVQAWKAPQKIQGKKTLKLMTLVGAPESCERRGASVF